MLRSFVVAGSVPLALGIGFRACERNENYRFNGTLNPGSVPENLKIALVGDDFKYVVPPRHTTNLFLDEGAEAIILAGDYDYYDNPANWEEQIIDAFGDDFPFFFSIGNHDVPAWDESSGSDKRGYQQVLFEHHTRAGTAEECVGDLGIDAICTYKGLLILESAVGTCSGYSQADHVDYVNDMFSQYASSWKICHWHKNQRLYQTGSKSDETGYEILDACRQHGAIVHTAHEHSYSRTYEMSHFEDYQYNDTSHDVTLRSEMDNPEDGGSSFLFVSGASGKTLRGWSSGRENNPWWAAAASSDGCVGPQCGSSSRIQQGVLFATFNVDGDASRSDWYFKDFTGRVVDEFSVFTEVSDTIPTTGKRNPCAMQFNEIPVFTNDISLLSVSPYTPTPNELTPVITLNEANRLSLTFRKLPVESPTQLEDITLQVFSAAEGLGEARMLVSAIHNDQPSRTVVVWDKEAEEWEKHTTWNSAQLEELFKEIVGKDDWVRGDDVTLVVENQGAERSFYSQLQGKRFAPTLKLEFKPLC